MRAPLLLLALLAMLPAAPRAAEAPVASASGGAGPAGSGAPATFLIVNPSGRGSQALAEGFLSDMSAALLEGWACRNDPRVEGRYHVNEADALASIARLKPGVALVSPGFYIAHRAKLDMKVVLRPVREHDGPAVVHVVTLAGQGARALEGRLGGQLAGEPAWVFGPVLGLPKGARRPTLVPLARTLEAVRELRAGALDGVLLHDAEWALLQRTGKADGLGVAFTSKPLPEGPVVTFGPDGHCLGEAWARLAGHEKGRAVLARMTLRGFEPADASAYDALAQAFDAARAEAP